MSYPLLSSFDTNMLNAIRREKSHIERLMIEDDSVSSYPVVLEYLKRRIIQIESQRKSRPF